MRRPWSEHDEDVKPRPSDEEHEADLRRAWVVALGALSRGHDVSRAVGGGIPGQPPGAANDYLRPDYPRAMLVEDVTILRGLLEAATEREKALREQLARFERARRAWEMDL